VQSQESTDRGEDSQWGACVPDSSTAAVVDSGLCAPACAWDPSALPPVSPASGLHAPACVQDPRARPQMYAYVGCAPACAADTRAARVQPGKLMQACLAYPKDVLVEELPPGLPPDRGTPSYTTSRRGTTCRQTALPAQPTRDGSLVSGL